MSTVCWRLATLVGAIVICAGGGLLQAEETTEQIIATLKAKTEAVKTVRADLRMTMTVMGQAIAMEGPVLAASPGKSRIEMSVKIGPMKMDQIIISDGVTAWTYQPMLKMVHRIDVAKVAAETGVEQAGQQGNDLTRPFASLPEKNIEQGRTERLAGIEVHVFEGTPAMPNLPQIPFKPAKVKIWVGTEDGLLRKSIMFDADGKEMMSQAYDNIEVNVEISEETFQFTPPDGVQVVDMTDGVLNMLKTMKR
jgi:outer membrane lipoprotein-sorting protein